jgi:hypothetical protein
VRFLHLAVIVSSCAACSGLVGADFGGWSSTKSEAEADGGADAQDPPPADPPPGSTSEASGPDASGDAATADADDGAAACPAGRDRCGAICVDLQTNDNHCGTCDTHCAANEDCVGGKCKVVGTLAACALTPTTCKQECARTGLVFANACGPGSVYGVLAFDYNTSNCKGASTWKVTTATTNWSDADYDSVECCCI